MGKSSDRDWENNKRNGACTSDWGFHIIYYMGVLAHELYTSLSRPTDKQDLLRTHRHLSLCQICREGYVYFKEVLASNPDPDIKATYSPANFRLLKKNEGYLDGLLARGKTI